jgi:ELWxxDGT repeat protein
VRDLHPGTGTGVGDDRRIVWQGRLYFYGSDGGEDAGNGELWRTDGTEAGTELVADLRPVGGSAPSSFAAGPDFLYFTAADATGERHPHFTDGTAAGTGRAPIAGAQFDPGADQLVRLGDRILLVANDWNSYGRELWAIVPPLFADDFESGATGAWSSTVP